MKIRSLDHGIGSTERVFVAHINDLNDFYLQREVDSKELFKLSQDLLEAYSDSLTNPSAANYPLKVDDYCACPSESGDWYRGLIRQIDSERLAWVYKIDYGDVQLIPLQYLQPLKEQFFSQPRLAFNCSLANLIKPPQGWPPKAIDEFQMRLTSTFLFARIVYYNSIRYLCEVELTERGTQTPFNKDFARYQTVESSIPLDDPSIYQMIPMEELIIGQPNFISMLYYLSPRRFYVYHQQKCDEYLDFHKNLQKAMRVSVASIQSEKNSPIAVRDAHAIWHRAIILEILSEERQIYVYFIDIGLRQLVPFESIAGLPREFLHQPAVAIPCRLYGAMPLYDAGSAIWTLDDRVHEEFQRLTTNLIECTIVDLKENLFYDIAIHLPKIGDLCDFLYKQNLILTTTMQNSGPPRVLTRPGLTVDGRLTQKALTDAGMSTMLPTNQPSSLSQRTLPMSGQSAATRLMATSVRNPGSSNAPMPSTKTKVIPKSPTTAAENGMYYITQVHSACEFFGYPLSRDGEMKALQRQLEEYYNAKANDPSLNHVLILEGDTYAAQLDNKYQRVVVQCRESDSKVRITFIDRGSEMVVDHSELLPLDSKFERVPIFAKTFRLDGFDETKSTATVTRSLKTLILEKPVNVVIKSGSVNEFYNVEVALTNYGSVNQLLLSNNGNIVLPPSATATPAAPSLPAAPISRPVHSNPPSSMQIESKVFTNSTRQAPNSAPTAPDVRMANPLNLNNPVNTAVSRAAPARFSDAANQPTSRFSTPPQQNPSSTWNNESNNRSNFSNANSGPLNMNFSRNPPTNYFPRNNENSGPNNFNQPSASTEQKRPFDAPPSSRNSQFDQQPRHNNFGRSHENNSNNENNFSNRPGQTFNNNRSSMQNNNSNNDRGQSSNTESFSRSTRDFGNRGHFDQGNDRPNYYRNQSNDQNDNNRQESRSGFRDFRGRGGGPGHDDSGRRNFDDNNNNNRQGFPPRGGFSDRGGRGGGRGGRGGFDNRGDSGFRKPYENKDSFNEPRHNQEPPRMSVPTFEAGNFFPENMMRTDPFEFVASHIEKPDDFYIQLTKSETDLITISDALQVEYRQCPEMDTSNLQMNQACLAQSGDNCWYRAVIIGTSAIQPKVRFIDFGDTTTVTQKALRQIPVKYCAKPPFAYRCTLADIKILPTANISKIAERCVGKRFQGKFVNRTAEKVFLLQSEQYQQILIDANAIKGKTEVQLPRLPCTIVQFEAGDNQFFIQDNLTTVDEIADLVQKEWENSATLTAEEVQQLAGDTMVLALYDEVPYRAIIRSEENENDVKVYYVDYGNTDVVGKASLKRCSEQLSTYQSQAKRCQLYGIPTAKSKDALNYLEEKSESDSIECSIVKEKEGIFEVLIYLDKECVNERFDCDLSSIEPMETAKTASQEETAVTPVPAEEKQDDASKQEDASEVVTEKPPQELGVVEEALCSTSVTSTKTNSRRGTLTHMENDRPYLYVQLLPDSEEPLVRISEIIERTLAEPQIATDCPIGDLVIARFTDDGNPYRARIQSFSAESNSYSVYFLDFGNIDENVPADQIFVYPNDLKDIPNQAQGFLLQNVSPQRWDKFLREFLQNEKLNDEIQFDLVDEQGSMIHLHNLPEAEAEEEEEKEKEEEQKAATPVELNEEAVKTVKGHISFVEKDCFYIQPVPSGLVELNELLKTVARDNLNEGSWAVQERCLVVNDENQLYRAEILSIDENHQYTVKCFDYGFHLSNRKHEQLYLLPDDEIFHCEPMVHQCRLQSDENADSSSMIEQIPSNELVTVEILNDANAPCWSVQLERNVPSDVNEEMSDNDKNNEMVALSTTQDEANSQSIMSNNQTIDFGEHDPSTMIKDDTQDSISSP